MADRTPTRCALPALSSPPTLLALVNLWLAAGQIKFNLVLESLVLGGAPREAVKMGVLIAIALALAFRWGVPFIGRHVYRFSDTARP